MPSTITEDDLDIRGRAEKLLRNSPYLNGRTLRLESHEGRLTLHGHVGTYFQKQMAQESLRHLEVAINNQLHVTW